MADRVPIQIMRAQPVRRVLACGMQVALGTLVLYVAFASPPDGLAWRAFLLILGAGALLLAVRGWAGGDVGIVLDEDGLRTEDGRAIAPLANVARVDRGTFAFKPSNGFVVRLRDAMPRAWTPGMWWRAGRRVGVGGVTGGAEGRAMADALAAMVAARDAGRRRPGS